MRVFRNFNEAGIIKNPVVTTGSFDGVHIGHKTILNRLRMLAEKYNGESVLITFDPHPRKVLYPETAGKDLKLINSQEEKLMLLEKAGLDNVIIIEFTREFSKITSEEFVRDILHGILHARVIVAGFNHHFGFNQEGDYKHLWNWQEKYDFEAEEIPEQEVYHETVSSTRIRKAISEGYMQRANAYLDHYYIIKGPVVEGREIKGFPPFLSVSIRDTGKLLPSAGIYAVTAENDAGQSKGMAIIVKEDAPGVLLDVFGMNNEFSGKDTLICFHKKIYGALNLSDDHAQARITAAREEISELIY